MVNNENKTLLTTTAATTICGLIFFMTSAAWAEDKTYEFDIPPENAARALNDFSRQSGIQLLFPYDVAARAETPAVKGAFSGQGALRTLLAATNLEVASETDHTISLRVKEAPVSANATDMTPDVIVTGTHIRGANSTSPVHTLTRRDIEQSGYSQIGDLMRSQPENFAGGQNPGVIAASAGNLGNTNYSGASTVNLRGLGTDATLVLINGHRLSADSFFQGSDISGIPLAAVRRIDIVPDGASALYGSDAVAGVVNIVLRKSYQGLSLNVQGGSANQGGGGQKSVSLLGGLAGRGWYGLADLEYAKQDPVVAAQRARTSGVTKETGLFPGLERKSLFSSVGHDLWEGASLSFDGLINDRRMTYATRFSNLAPLQMVDVATPSYVAALTLDSHLAGDWNLKIAGVRSASRNRLANFYPAYNIGGATTYRNSVQSVEATADGTMLQLPSGPMKLAVGGGYRRETFVYVSGAVDAHREDTYFYAETLVPFITPSSTRAGLHELELNASVRAEHYKTLGSTTNPKLGLRYVPIDTLTLRTTWGTSFKAPSFLQMFQQKYLYLLDASDMGYSGAGTALLTQGGNANLKPERSRSWTFGGDWTPGESSARVSATWFHINYTNRVVQPAAIVAHGLSDPLYSPYVEPNPSAARQAALIADANEFDNYSSGAYDPNNVVAVLLDSYTNATAQRINGLDLSYRQTFRTSWGTFAPFAGATAIRLDQQFIVSAPLAKLSGTIFNVPNLKARAGLSWERGGLSLTGFVNYVSGEWDTGVTPARRVGSWTTADVTASYTEQRADNALSGIRVAVAVTNLFDRQPPHAESPTAQFQGIDYDSTNASIMGRFVSVSVTKDW